MAGQAPTEEEKKLVAKLGEMVREQKDLDLQEAEAAAFLNEASLLRYLRARDGNLGKAKSMVIDSIKWRRDYKPDQITLDDVAGAAQTGKIYQLGRGREGHAIVVFRVGIDAASDPDTKVRHLVYVLEDTIRGMAGSPVQEWIWVIDFKKSPQKKFSFSDIGVAKKMVTILTSHYPERLYKMMIFNSSFAFKSLWWMVKGFLTRKTIDKVIWMEGSDEVKADLIRQYIAPDQLEKDFGGEMEKGFDFNEAKARVQRQSEGQDAEAALNEEEKSGEADLVVENVPVDEEKNSEAAESAQEPVHKSEALEQSVVAVEAVEEQGPAKDVAQEQEPALAKDAA